MHNSPSALPKLDYKGQTLSLKNIINLPRQKCVVYTKLWESVVLYKTLYFFHEFYDMQNGIQFAQYTILTRYTKLH